MEGNTRIIHIDGDIRRLDFLRTQHEIHIREEELRLGRIVDALGPVILLVGKTRAVEHTRIHDDREAHIPGITHLSTDITHITHLLGDKRAVGEILLMRRAVRINGERHTFLTDSKLERTPWFDTSISIEHLDFALIAEVDFCLVAHLFGHLTSHIDTGSSHFEASLPFLGLVFILRAYRTANLRSTVKLLLFILSKHRCRHHSAEQQGHCLLLHIHIINLLAELKNRLKISIFLWRKKLCISLIFSNFVVSNYKVITCWRN